MRWRRRSRPRTIGSARSPTATSSTTLSRALTPRLLAALEKETGEFVRPSLVRALAALAPANQQVRDALIRDAMRGQDYFRSSVIEALGDYRIAPAAPRLVEIAKLEGPLQDDAVLSLGKLGDKAALGPLAELQRSGTQVLQPSVAAAICLLGQNCSSHLGFLQKTLGFAEDFPGYQELLRSAASGLGALGAHGNAEAVNMLLDIGVPSQIRCARRLPWRSGWWRCATRRCC